MAERMLIQLFGTTSGDAAGAFDVPEDGAIVGVDWDVRGYDLDTSGDTLDAQLSFLATSQFSVNDARGIISSVGISANNSEGTATNPIPVTAQKYVNMDDPPLMVAGGERIYLHLNLSTGVTASVRCIVHLSARTATRRARRRR